MKHYCEHCDAVREFVYTYTEDGWEYYQCLICCTVISFRVE